MSSKNLSSALIEIQRNGGKQPVHLSRVSIQANMLADLVRMELLISQYGRTLPNIYSRLPGKTNLL